MTKGAISTVSSQFLSCMTYELLVLPKSWLFARGDPHKYDVLAKAINKAYSKPMGKYGIIQSNRIKDYSNFLDELQITEGKECFISILLGSEQVFTRIKDETGFKRKFDYEIYPLSKSGSSDIPKEYRNYFEPLTLNSKVKVTIADLSTIIDDKIADRVLGLCGYKTFYESDMWVDDFASKVSTTKDYELTSFASFMSGIGSQLLDYTLANFIANPESKLINQTNIKKCVVHAVVIKEHNLVPYYTKCCNFHLSEKPDCVVPDSGESSLLENGIKASRDFHLSFLRREVDICVRS